MTRFHAVLEDECGGEFGVTFEAEDGAAAVEYLADQYPESRCVQLENPSAMRKRERRTYRGEW